jgi:hypothetical protein
MDSGFPLIVFEVYMTWVIGLNLDESLAKETTS